MATGGNKNKTWKEVYCTHRSQRGDHACQSGSQSVSIRFWSGGRDGSKEKAWARAVIRVFKGKARQGRVNSLGLACLNNSSRI